MPTNVIDPSEWNDLVRRLRDDNDATVASRLAERERRLDNYFADFTFVPQVAQSLTSISGTVLYAEAQRIGRWVHLIAGFRLSAAGNAGQVIRMFLPETLPALGVSGVDAAINVGNFEVYDASTTDWFYGDASMDAGSRSVTGKSYGATSGMGVELPALALASGDEVRINIHYPTSASRLF